MNIRKFTLLGVLAFFISCDDSNDDSSGTSEASGGELSVNISNMIGDQMLVLNSEKYSNTSKESFSVSEFKYILSDFVFINDKGDEFVYPKSESYFLIDAEDKETLTLDFINIPKGNYTAIKFGFGVDQSKYPIASGTLNFIPKAEEAKMLWGWAAGYKFIKFEGEFTSESNPEMQDYKIHVGSHGANLDNYKSIELMVGNIEIKVQETSVLTLQSDISKIFDSSNTMSLKEKADVQIDPVNSPKYAANIQTMFSIKK